MQTIRNLLHFKRDRKKAGGRWGRGQRGSGDTKIVKITYLRLETGDGDLRLGENERDLLRTTGDLDLYLGTGERERLLL